MARPLRIEYPGAVYHVIGRGNNRQAVFRDDADRRVYLEKLRHYCAAKEVHLLCYCLVSNHVHLLVETPQGNLSKLMQAFQTSYTRYFNGRHGRTGHVFEQRYKALVVDRDSYLLQVSRYIHLNPVGAKAAKRPQDYRWSSYRAYLSDQGSRGLRREVILGQFGGKAHQRMAKYRAFVEGVLQGGSRWSALPIREQAFVGDEHFVEEARRKGKHQGPPGEHHYRLAEIVEAVGAIVGITPEQLRQPVKDERVQRGRELFMYVARRYSGASLREIIARLGVRDQATVSHGIRRAERRLEEEGDFRRRAEQILRRLSHSRIQA
jgi:REP element-mobilizing transposase RayT